MSSPEIYPKPTSFYLSTRFSGERARTVFPEIDTAKLTFFDTDAHQKARILSQLQLVKFSRFGRLEGEYMVMLGAPGAMLAIDQNGTPIKINCDSDNDLTHTSSFSQQEQYVASKNFHVERDMALQNWNNTDILNDIPFLNEGHSFNNYYHFCIGFAPQVRHFKDASSTVIGILDRHLERPFQRELISLTYGDRIIKPISTMTRLNNPTLLTEPFSNGALQWLQTKVGRQAKKADRLIYISRQSSLVGRTSGLISKTDDFNRFLSRHNFETIDFGAGEITVLDQIAMLDGARVILSAHGANLTNIAFAEQGISVIELVPSFWTNVSYMQIALANNLNYFGVICHREDETKNMIIDVKTLGLALEAALDAG